VHHIFEITHPDQQGTLVNADLLHMLLVQYYKPEVHNSQWCIKELDKITEKDKRGGDGK